MNNDQEYNRRSIRLAEYDYQSDGAYFITICIEQKKCLLGTIENGVMKLNNLGKIVEEEWMRSFEIRKEIQLDKYVVMPNHFHAIVVFARDKGVLPLGGLPSAPTDNRLSPKPQSLSTFIAGFKGAVTRRISKIREFPNGKFWQRNYYEHIIRNEDSLNKIRYYIQTNPENWSKDSLFIAE